MDTESRKANHHKKKKNPGQSQTKTKMISDLSATFNARNIKMTIKFGGEKV